MIIIGSVNNSALDFLKIINWPDSFEIKTLLSEGTDPSSSHRRSRLFTWMFNYLPDGLFEIV